MADDQRATQDLSAMINQRSMQAMGGAQPGSPFGPPSQGLPPSMHNMVNNGHHSPHMNPRVLVPQTSPTLPSASMPGGFLNNSYAPTNSPFFAPPQKPATPTPGSWQPTGDLAGPPGMASNNVLDSYLNNGNGINSPPRKKHAMERSDSDIDLAGFINMNGNANGSGSAVLPDQMDKIHLLSQPNSRPGSAAPLPSQQSLPETDAEGSSPVIGARHPGGPRRIADDDESQSQTIPFQQPPPSSTEYNIRYLQFSNRFPQVSEAARRKAFDDAGGDIVRAAQSLVASNPMMAAMMGGNKGAAGNTPNTSNPSIVARSQAMPPSQNYSQQPQTSRPAHAYPYPAQAQNMNTFYSPQMMSRNQQMLPTQQRPQQPTGYQQNYAVRTRVVPTSGVQSMGPPVLPDLEAVAQQMRMAKFPEAQIANNCQQLMLKHQLELAEWNRRMGPAYQAAMQQQAQQQQQSAQQAQALRRQQMSAQAPPRPQVSQLVAAHRPQGPPQLAKRKRRDFSDSDSGGNYSGDSDDYGERPNEERELEALNFFNACKVTDLPDYTACTLEAAKTIIGLRPFASPDDIRNKLKKTKGISNKLFDSLVDVLEAYLEVDRVFAQCTEHSKELSSTMRIWAGSTRDAPKNLGIDDGTLNSGADIDTGVHLIELDQTALDQSTDASASEEVKKAFAGYLREQPSNMSENVHLKGYQLLGLNWLNLLYSKGLSCILADEMGLGKTCQVISFLSHLKTKGIGPHLVIVPSSTLDNWLREFDVFSPGLKVYSYYGTQSVRYDLRHDLKAATDIDVIVTTYNMATGTPDDRKFLRKMEFKTCTYDEGHQLKNSESKKYKDLMEIKVPWRLLLTGTPLQNNLTELISLLSFILPKVFGSADESLKAIFKVPPEAQANLLSRRRIQNAQRIMMPFVLRRKKTQVLQELPSKIERIEYIEMTPRQRAIYIDRLESSKRTILQDDAPTPASNGLPDDLLDDDEDDFKPKKGRKKKAQPKRAVQPKIISNLKPEVNTSNVLMDLRKAANHPMLFRRLFTDEKIEQMSKDCLKEIEFSLKDPKYIYEDMSIMTDFELHRFVRPYSHLRPYALTNNEWMDAGKVQWLVKNLPEMRARGDRVLLFSQFTQVLELLETVLDTMGVRYLKLTGQTNVAERQGLVDDYYNDPDITIFLLSTRAGGLGLNLAAANVVIIYDLDFNPHNDKQAEDRAWRIGQTRDVHVIRLIVKDTIEEDMFNLAQTKLTLDSEVSKVEQDAVSGTATPVEGELPLENKETVVLEKKAKQTIMKSLRAKLESGAVQMSQSSSSEGFLPPVETPLAAPTEVPTVGAQGAADVKEETA